jgi:RNA polymerase sigma-70 factor, ECF subfamily
MTEDRTSRDTELRLHLLVLRCQAGDERAFARLFREFGQRTLGYLHGLVGDDAEDVQQEVWVAVFRGIASLANPRAFRTWLYRTTRHRAIDFLRRRKRERELIVDAEPEAVEAIASAESGALDLAEPALLHALAGLPPPQREVLLLRYQDDLSYMEIALVVGCPIGTVRTRLHHAKRRLQQLLERGTL